jgi:hypothetical protein
MIEPIFSDAVINNENSTIRVNSFSEANRTRAMEAMKVLQINTNTQNGNSFSDINNFDYQGTYKEILLQNAIRNVQEYSKKLYSAKVKEDMLVNNMVKANEQGTNVLAHSAVKRIEKYTEKVNKNKN